MFENQNENQDEKNRVTKHVVNQELQIDHNQSVQDAFMETSIFIYYKIKKQIGLFMKNPQNPIFTHQARVQTREFRSCLSFVRPALKRQEYKTVNSNLRDIAHEFGNLRTIDVIKRDWERLCKQNLDIFSDYSRLANILQDNREQEQARVYKKLSEGFAEDKLSKICDFIHNDNWKRDGKVKVLDFSVPRLKQWYNNLIHGMSESSMDSLEEVHELRVTNKKVRYVKFYLEEILEEDFMVSLDQFKEWQDDMGAYCDAGFHIPLLQELYKRDCDNSLAYECGVLSGYMLSNGQVSIKRLKETIDK